MTQGELDIDSLVSVVVNDAIENIHEHFVLVLDDYHNVDDSEPVAMFVSRFIQAMDDNCHVIISSRKLISLPDLPLLVARGQVGGLSYEDLSFSAFEIQTLVLQNYLTQLTDEEARAAAQNVEGWITGLLMGTQIPRPNGQVRLGVGRPNNMGLYDFMAQQVLETQTPDMQDFLLRSSLLEEFDVALCQKVIGEGLGVEQDWQMLTDTLFQRNLFVLPVGEESISLRYHHLFKEFLQSTILHTRPQEADLILNRLVEIYSARGDWERAFAMLQRMGRVDELIRYVAKTGSELVARGRILTLQEWIESLPTEVVRSNPDLLSLQAVVAEKRGNSRLALELMDKALELLDDTSEPRILIQNLIRRSSFLRTLGDYPRALEDCDRAIDLTINQPDRRDLLAEALRVKGATLYYMGNPKDGLEHLNHSVLVYQELKDELSQAILLVDIGQVYTSIGNYISAEHAYMRSLDYWQRAGNATWLANILNNLGDLQRLLGDYESA
ncbi:MAG: tetratricopeptide repeat protein, partial [Anaerolineaceae bacterium]|nr:tetratricopeptide repeat protein [Anaerolineaceae bacterium]